MRRYQPDHIPSYRLHKSTGRAVVTLNGRDWPLGDHGTPESIQAYHALIARWLAGGRCPLNEAEVVTATDKSVAGAIIVNDLLDARIRQLEKELPEATLKAELQRIKSATIHLRELYGTQPACSLSPLKLKSVRDRTDASDAGVNRRHFITSLEATTTQHICPLAQNHWFIENCMHQVLDISFHEDEKWMRRDPAPKTSADWR